MSIDLPIPGRIVPLHAVAAFKKELLAANPGLKIVATNGCFDLLHVGHLRYLTAARALGDFLWVGVNGDASVRALKGPTRPIVNEAERAELLAAWRIVDAVTIFPEVRATHFLSELVPHIYAKGGDYTVESLDAEERTILIANGVEIKILPMVQGKSTSALIENAGGR